MKTAFLLFLILFGLLPYAQQQKPGGISKMSPAAGKDRFFWYIGKKINDSTLIAATGAAVTLKKAGNQLEVKTAKDPFTKMILELRQTEQRKKELVTNATTHQQAAVIYSYVRNIVEEYAQIANTYAGLADNRIDLPSLPYSSSWQQQEMSSISLKGPCAPEAFSEDIPGWINTDHNSVMAWVKAHEKEINFQTPAPPVLDVSCYGCDEEKTRDYEYADSAYRSDLFQEETENIHKAVRIMRFATEYPSKELAGILNDLDGSLKYLLGRILLKTQAVEKQWRHDFWRLQTVVKVLLEVERQLQLFYGAGDYGLMQTAVSLLHRDSIQKHFDLAVKDRNYPVVLNAAFWIGLERQRQLLGGPDNFSAEQFEAIMRFNRFKLTHEFDIKWRGDTDGNDQLQVKLRAEDVYYFAIPDSNCRLLFVAHQGTRTHMSADRLVKYSVSEAKRPDALYSSPQRFATTFPIIMMDGCNETASFAFNTDVNGENYA
ncbi:MAG TPA: hypothetical protein VFZ78_00745, partial [Flavisolibacter sp.]